MTSLCCTRQMWVGKCITEIVVCNTTDWWIYKANRKPESVRHHIGLRKVATELGGRIITRVEM